MFETRLYMKPESSERLRWNVEAGTLTWDPLGVDLKTTARKSSNSHRQPENACMSMDMGLTDVAEQSTYKIWCCRELSANAGMPNRTINTGGQELIGELVSLLTGNSSYSAAPRKRSCAD